MSARCSFALLLVLGACGVQVPERWSMSATPTRDQCGLVDAGLSVVPEVMERVETGNGAMGFQREGQTGPFLDIECEQLAEKAACASRALSTASGEQLHSWIRGAFSADRKSFNGTLSVVKTCAAFYCPPEDGSTTPSPCRSDYAFNASLIADRFPGPCPPPGTKPESGAPATLTLYKGSTADNLRISEMKDDGTFSEGLVLRTAPGDISANSPTHIGAWYIVHTKSGGKLSCVGAFRIDGPRVRMVIQ